MPDAGEVPVADAALPGTPDATPPALPDASVPGGTPDAAPPPPPLCVFDADCPQAVEPAGQNCQTTRCIGGTACVVQMNNGNICNIGTGPGQCHEGACCMGCWDGTACQTGTSLPACGSEGRACLDCTDTDWCSDDTCHAASYYCLHTLSASGTTCPDGTCDGFGNCDPVTPGACGGFGQPCCAAMPYNVCSVAGATCDFGTNTCVECSGPDQPCCYPGEICDDHTICVATGDGGYCQCGGPGQPCCYDWPFESCEVGHLCGGPPANRICT